MSLCALIADGLHGEITDQGIAVTLELLPLAAVIPPLGWLSCSAPFFCDDDDVGEQHDDRSLHHLNGLSVSFFLAAAYLYFVRHIAWLPRIQHFVLACFYAYVSSIVMPMDNMAVFTSLLLVFVGLVLSFMVC